MENLSDVFSETEEVTETEETLEKATAETEETSAEETETTVDDDATTTVAEQDEAKPDSEKTIPIKAYQEEKRKRQELEERLSKLEATPKEDDTDYITQTELKDRAKQEAISEIRTQIFKERLEEHYPVVSKQYDDYTEMELIFSDLAKDNEPLRQQFLLSKNPPEFAYKTAQTHKILQESKGDLMGWIKANYVKEVKPKEKVEPKKPNAPSLATATESEKNSAPIAKSQTLEALFEGSEI